MLGLINQKWFSDHFRDYNILPEVGEQSTHARPQWRLLRSKPIFPFHHIRDKDFVKTNANEIKEPCAKCGGESHRFDVIQCDVCDKWTHFVCTSLTKDQFDYLGQSSDLYICSAKCEMKLFPFHSLSKDKCLLNSFRNRPF